MTLSPQEHLEKCREVKRTIESAIDMPCRLGGGGETRRARLLFLASVLQNMSAGSKGAGLSGGVAQENLWREMLADMDVGFSDTPPPGGATKDADYYFKGYPLSHKTLGYNSQSAQLALAWSKNPKEGIQRTEFESSMLILSFRKQRKKSPDQNWNTARQGVHLIPLHILPQIVTEFDDNNKSDSIIKQEYVGQLIAYSQTNSLSVYFDFDYTLGEPYVLSYWRNGRGGAIPK